MERAFKLEGGQRHYDDATSVVAWVEEIRGMGDDNVDLYYNPQGADDDKTGLWDGAPSVVQVRHGRSELSCQCV